MQNFIIQKLESNVISFESKIQQQSTEIKTLQSAIEVTNNSQNTNIENTGVVEGVSIIGSNVRARDITGRRGN